MKCDNPVLLKNLQYVSCGQCMPCRINRKRLWMHRMMLEMTAHSESSFVTLTYEEEPLDGSLNPKHLQDWLKRIRKNADPLRLRFYGVGEYGDASGRPHYHIALFGYPHCLRGKTRLDLRSCCPWCDRLRETWGRGGILSGPLTAESAQYIVGYVTKKLTKHDDPRLDGRHPEFARMSRNPGIGVGFVDTIADSMRKFNLDSSQSDVPVALRHGKKLLPLGTHMRRKLREALGKDVTASLQAQYEYSLKMLDLQQVSKDTGVSVKEILRSRGANAAKSVVHRDKLRKKSL